MDKLSVIIPSRNEIFLSNTVEDIFAKATGEIEVIVNLDGYWPNPPLKDRKNLIILHRGSAMGLRSAVNSGVAISTGKYIMKVDAHCMFDEGFDEKLKMDCDENWLVIPRRYSLDAELWQNKNKTPIDYHYLDCPMTNKEYFQFHGVPWSERGRERKDPQYDIDETMSFQGSLWFMHKKYFEFLGNMNEEGYGTFSQEPQELGNKVWLSGGKVITNKKTWYSHLHKGKQWGRMYHMSGREVVDGHKYSAQYWMKNSWNDRIHDIEWLIDRFMPIPTWPENWIELLDNWRKENE